MQRKSINQHVPLTHDGFELATKYKNKTKNYERTTFDAKFG